MERSRSETKASKNRHTRPCRYFQTNICQKTADECDFAHIISSEALKEPRHARPCRFYAAGYCKNGDDCRFRHEAENFAADLRESPRSFASDDNNLPPLYIPPTPVSSPPGYYPVYDYTVPPCYYSEEVPYYFNPTGTQTTTVRAEPVAHDRDESTSTPRSRSKGKMYKTKPCKFYRTQEGCPKDKECGFIHEESERRIPGASPTSEDQTGTGLPSKPLSPLEESHKRGYYPITWRVIGGGVLMGVNKSPNPNDGNAQGPPVEPQKLLNATPPSRDIDLESTLAFPIERTSGSNISSRHRPSASFDVVTLNMDGPNTSLSTNSSRTRARANSNPSTPRISQVTPATLFAAAELP
ncbi:hypothetical protein PM082_017053 [Marasmius tenuissimus]|nr:hypothetical protein PM082_017053 [Marasmius tenuissimus]